MRRGAVWTAAGGPDYAGKPRPVVIVQTDDAEELSSVTVCPFTSDPSEAPAYRIRVEPDSKNGLKTISSIMVEKILTISRTKLGHRVGHLNDEDMLRMNRALLVFLGLAE